METPDAHLTELPSAARDNHISPERIISHVDLKGQTRSNADILALGIYLEPLGSPYPNKTNQTTDMNATNDDLSKNINDDTRQSIRQAVVSRKVERGGRHMAHACSLQKKEFRIELMVQ